jgi:hypothetical protein
LKPQERDLEEPYHGHVVQPVDLIEVRDGDGLDSMPQESLEGKGGGQRVGIGTDGDEDSILRVEKGEKLLEVVGDRPRFSAAQPESVRGHAGVSSLFARDINMLAKPAL